jgi:hypothetical protein
MGEPPDSCQTLEEARRHYFDANGFAPDGGYGARWVRVDLGPLPFFFPNTGSRRRAVRFHDLHHVLTGYRTDLLGEAQIGAWELASGCADHHWAWYLNLAALGIGLFLNPKALWLAFVRGRHTCNLYRRSFDENLLKGSVGSVRAELRLDSPPPSPTRNDRLVFAVFGVAALAVLFLPTLSLAALALASAHHLSRYGIRFTRK